MHATWFGSNKSEFLFWALSLINTLLCVFGMFNPDYSLITSYKNSKVNILKEKNVKNVKKNWSGSMACDYLLLLDFILCY